MHLFDTRTLLFTITIALACRALVLIHVWRVERQYLPIGYWASGSILISIGVLLVGLRNIAPPVVSIVLAHTLLVFGWLLITGGNTIAAERTPPWRAGVILAIAVVAGVAWYQFVTPSFVARTVAVSVPPIAFNGWAAIACLRARPSTRQTTLRLLGGLLAVEAAGGLWKLAVIVRDDIGSLSDSGPAMVPYFAITLFTIIIGTVLFVLLAAQRLQEDLDCEISERMEREKALRLAALVFENSSESMMITDAEGVILNVNPAFTTVTGFAPWEAIGQTPRILKSDRHDANFYQSLWGSVLERGAWQGEVWNRHKNGSLFAARVTINSSHRSDGSTESRVALFHDVTEQMKSAELIYRQAHFDALTGLPNRYFFFDQLSKEVSRARRSGHRVGLLFMDLNDFKPVNDLYGHAAGDQVLKVAAERWLAAIRSGDTLARLGGDEFALIVRDLQSPDDLAAIAHKLSESLTAVIPLRGESSCTVGVSAGGSVYPDNATEIDSLIAAADAAMYEAKAGFDRSYALSKAEATKAGVGADWVVLDHNHLVGVATIDAQHQQLARMVNQANRAVKEGRPEQELREILTALIGYTGKHFDTELAYMREHAYPDLAAHNRQHQELLTQVGQLVGRFEAGDELKLLQVIKDWLIGHIQHADRELGTFLSALHVK